jgi:uncharacterized protein (TIGR02246 family)
MPAENDAHVAGIDLSSLRELAERYAAAWSSHNAAGIAALYSPDGSRSVNGSEPYVGQIAIAVALQQFMIPFPDLRLTLNDVLIVGDGAEVHWTLSGGTGQHTSVKGFEEWRMGKDGLIEESQAHFSMVELQRQTAKGTTA